MKVQLTAVSIGFSEESLTPVLPAFMVAVYDLEETIAPTAGVKVAILVVAS